MSQSKLSPAVWTTQRAFIFAAIGSAVGLGNLWKFPYITGENGGGAFVLVYLLCIILIGLPILIAEITLGKSGKASPPMAMENLTKDAGVSRAWVGIGINGVLGGMLILSFYAVIAGWALHYFVESLMGGLSDMTVFSAAEHFDELMASPMNLTFWHSIIMLMTVLIVARGVTNGIEKAINIMMPALFVVLIVLLGYALTTGAFMQSVSFLFEPDFSALTGQSVLVALGHAFFTLSLGFGTMMVYGSYMPKDYSIVRASLWIVAADTLIALVAGLIIFSIVFSNDLAPGSGPGLLFQTLPIAFAQMTGGWFFGTLFFGLVVVAALSSAISMMEPAVSWVEQKWKINRYKAAWGLGGVAWVLGLGTILSFNLIADVIFIGERSFFECMDFFTSNQMLPLGGFFTALFVGWVWHQTKRDQETGMPAKWSTIFGFALKFIAPALVAIVFVANL